MKTADELNQIDPALYWRGGRMKGLSQHFFASKAVKGRMAGVFIEASPELDSQILIKYANEAFQKLEVTA